MAWEVGREVGVAGASAEGEGGEGQGKKRRLIVIQTGGYLEGWSTLVGIPSQTEKSLDGILPGQEESNPGRPVYTTNRQSFSYGTHLLKLSHIAGKTHQRRSP